MDDRGRTEVPNARLGSSVAFKPAVVDWHQSCTRVAGNLKFHGDDATRFLHTKSDEFSRVELYKMRLQTIDRRRIGTHVKDCS